MPEVEMNEQLKAQLISMSLQGVMDNQRLAQNTLLAYQKDLFQGAQGDSPQILGAISTGDRVPVTK